ncbi:MAG TPA: hypothetical protein VGI75_13640, partial [Pirellulales bacterium]
MNRRNKIIVAVAIIAIGAALALEFRKRKVPGEAATVAGNSTEATKLGSGATAPTARPSFDGLIEPGPASSGDAKSGNSYNPVSPVTAETRAADGASDSTGGGLVDLSAPEERHQITDGD